MHRFKLHGFFTGLHFALLQLCYLLLLQFQVSSTYLTYALIVSAWMAGTIAGLALKSLGAGRALVIGVLAYYGALVTVSLMPLAWFTLPAAGAAVFLSGLWAGRFFVVMLPHIKRVDSLFFHENNGFLVGLVATLIAFTQLGHPFVVWAPLVSAATLFAHARRILRQPTETLKPR